MSVARILSGIILILVGLTLVTEIDIPWKILGAVVLVAIGLVLMTRESGASNGGLVATGILVFFFASMLPSIPEISDGNFRTFTDSRVVVDDEDDLRGSYSSAAGALTLDLTKMDTLDGLDDMETEISSGAGEILVRVPAEFALDIKAGVGIGSIDVVGERSDGFGADVQTRLDGPAADAPTLSLDIELGIGQIRVVRDELNLKLFDNEKDDE